jgi:predicted GNAT family acetyltransferase
MTTAVMDVPERSRFEVTVDGALAGFAEYRLGQGHVIFTHTEIDAAFGGKGLGRILAEGALDQVVATGQQIVPLCPYINGTIARNPQYEPSVDRALWAKLGGR